jgi:hypothetical protein
MLIKSFVVANSVSFLFAVTSMLSFSVNLFAVSFTTAKACGKTVFRIFSILSITVFSNASISL